MHVICRKPLETCTKVVKSPVVNVYEQEGGLQAADATPAFTESTSSIEIASAAERDIAAEPGASGPRMHGKARHGCETCRQKASGDTKHCGEVP